MCGIAGVIFKSSKAAKPVREVLQAFSKAIFHRGPDDTGMHCGDRWGFLSQRLSIVDRSGGNQPIYSEDRNIGIVFNGEIYNFTQLRAELEAKGSKFHTHSDTEVVLRLYELEGAQSFARLNGMFAFAIWDERSAEVILVRDHFGIKPLYVYEDGQKILFCSEIKGLLAQSELELDINPAGVQDYLVFRYTQAPLTIFSRIRRLEPGSFVRIKDGLCTQFKYWDVEYAANPKSYSVAEYVEQARANLLKAVKSQLMGEVPIGVLLSGGVDSSAIAYSLHKLGANLTTFNIGFPEVNEFEFSRAVAKQNNLKHVEITFTIDELVQRFDQVLWAIDEPLADPACFPLYRLCEELKKEVTVVLSGEGGDEQFGGYPQYLNFRNNTALNPEQRFEHFLRESFYFLDNFGLLLEPTLPPHHLRNYKYFAEASGLNSMLAFDMRTWMPDNLMMKADKILMAHSLEGRFPFLDLELSVFCAGLPQDLKISPDGIGKWLLKEAMKQALPESIIGRPKMGFSVPLQEMLQKLEERFRSDLEQARHGALAQVLDIPQISKLFQSSSQSGFALETLKVWTLMILISWTNRFAA